VARRALIVGIDTCGGGNDLNACVADAKAMAEVLSRHKDGDKNFDCILLLDRMEDGSPITRPRSPSCSSLTGTRGCSNRLTLSCSCIGRPDATRP
jgi:hypothetical protein